MKRTGGGADRQDLRDLQKQNAAGGSSKNIHFQRFGGIDRIGFPENIARDTFCHQVGIAPEVLFYNVYTPLQYNANACDGFPIGKNDLVFDKCRLPCREAGEHVPDLIGCDPCEYRGL